MSDKDDTKRKGWFFVPARHPKYFHSWMGYLGFFWQFVLLCCVSAQFLNGINTMWFFTPGFLIATVVLYIIFYLVNMFYYGPYYKKRKEIHLGKCGDIKMDNCKPASYNEIVRNDLKYHNDEWHFKVCILGYGFVLITYGIMLAFDGNNTFQPLPTVPTNDDIMALILVKIFQAGICFAAGAVILFFLFETRSCLHYSYWTSLNKQQKEVKKELGREETDLHVDSEKWQMAAHNHGLLTGHSF
jgi:hypothetical protein